MNVVFSGTMAQPRWKETKKFEDYGINVQNGVRKNTDCLVIGYNPGNSKMSKAKQYGIKIMEEQEFLDWLAEERPEYFL